MADNYFIPSNLNQTVADIFQGQESYIRDMQNQFDEETMAGRRQFARTAEDAATQARQFSEDFARFTSRDQQEKNRVLASTSKDFAAKMSNAANAYGQRGILNSGIALRNAQKAQGDYGLAQQQIETGFAQAQQDRDIAKQRQEQRYGITKNRLGEDLTTYNKQRTLGSESNLQNAMDRFAASGKLGVYGGTVENVNRSNVYRLKKGMTPATSGMGGIPLIYNPQ